MDLVNKYLNLSEAMFPGSPEYRKKFDSSFNPYDPEGKVKKALKLKPYGYRDSKPASDEDETPSQQPAMKRRGRPKKMSEAMSAVDRIDARFKKLSGRSMGAAAKEYGDEAKRLQKEIDAQKAENERRQAAMKKEEADLDEATPSAMQVKQGIGIARDKRYAKGNVTGAVRAMNKINPGLAQHPVVKKELQKQNEEVEIDEKCWDGYTARGMKKKDGRMVPNCVPTTEQNNLVSRYLSRASVHQEAVTYDSGFRKMAPVKDRFGNKVKNVAQHLARQGMQAAIKDLKKGPEAGKKQVS